MEDDDIDLGHVEHPQRHRRAEAERDGEGGRLDVHLKTTHSKKGELGVNQVYWLISDPDHKNSL